MFQTILVPTDGSPLSIKAVRAAVELARLHAGRIVALSVAEPAAAMALAGADFTLPAESYDESERVAEAQQRAEFVVQAARTAGVAARAVVVVSPRPHEEIINAAVSQHCDLIVMASHGRRGLNKLIMGSETEKVLLNSSIPVLVFRPQRDEAPALRQA